MSAWTEFRDKVEDGFSFVVKYIFPVVLAVAGGGTFKIPAWAITVISKIVPALIGIVEQASPAPGTGAAKKAAVLTATEQVLALMGATFTGGAALNFAGLKPVLSVLIDQTVAATNAIAPQIIANDPVASGPPTIGSGINAPVDAP